MKRALFARFGSAENAEAALSALRSATDVRLLRIQTHRHVGGGRLTQEVQESAGLVETDLRHGVVVGLVTGVVTGALLGALLFGLVLGPVGDAWAGAGIGALIGAVVGMLMAGLFGVGLTDRRLQRLARGLRDEEAIVTIETGDHTSTDRVRRIVEVHGGRVAEKSAV